MQLTFHGAVRTVTGSMHLVECRGKRVLLDCGLYQGPRQEAFLRNSRLPFDPASIDLVILSHAHIDHCGNLPSLVKSGYRGDIICTGATRDLCGVMLRDTARIMASDAIAVSKVHHQRNEPPVKPLFEERDAEEAISRLTGVAYGRRVEPLPGVGLTFLDAGHILGAAIVQLELSEEGRALRLVFTGDLGRRHLAILRDPETVDRADVLVSECTYGDRSHGAASDVADRLAAVVGETAARGGRVIIPAFALGRTQEIVFNLHLLREAGKIPDIPVYVDSPLAMNATSVFRLHPECFDAETNEHVSQREDPFGFSRLTYVRSAADSRALNARRDPMVIISASGMCEAGRVLHHLRHSVGDERNTILLVSWQAPHTLGRRLMDGDERVRILGEEHVRRARVEKIDGFSAHADREGLIEWVESIRTRPGSIYLVHGEEEPAEAFAALLGERGFGPVTIPRADTPYPL